MAILLATLLAIAAAQQGAVAFSARSLLQNVPSQCWQYAGALQGACSNDLNKLGNELGIKGGSSLNDLAAAAQQVVAQGKVDTALGAFQPSSGCCKAACQATSQLCLCNQGVIDVAGQSLKVDSGTANKVLSSLASKCGFPNLSIPAGTCAGKQPGSFTC